VAVGDDQGIASLDPEDHPRADRRAPEQRHPVLPADQDVGAHGALERRVQLLDGGRVGRGIGEHRVGRDGVPGDDREEVGPAGDVHDAEQQAGNGQPDPAPGSAMNRPQRQDAQQHGDEPRHDPEERDPRDGADQRGDRQPADPGAMGASGAGQGGRRPADPAVRADGASAGAVRQGAGAQGDGAVDLRRGDRQDRPDVVRREV
jgi:hypothetical protein